MKTFLLCLTTFFTTTIVTPTLRAEEQTIYFAASHVSLDDQGPIAVNGDQILTLSYDLPCFASLQEIVNNPVVEDKDGLSRENNRVPPVIRFHLTLTVILKGNPELPCADVRRESHSIVVNTRPVSGLMLGYIVVNENQISATEGEDLYFMANPIRLNNIHDISFGHKGLTLTYEVPCWASKVTPVTTRITHGNPINPAANTEIAWGMILGGNPMLPCAGTLTAETDVISYVYQAEGQFLGFKTIE